MKSSVVSELSIALNASAAAEDVVLCAAVDLVEPGAGEEHWVHLLPGTELRTEDGRGPWHVKSMNALIAASLPKGQRLILDENHSNDHAAPLGLPSPAAGWIEELQARADGLWGRVTWTPAGAEVRKGYRGISPALLIDKAGNVLRVLRASLVNFPNLKGLAQLQAQQTEHDMNFLAKLAAKLGLADGASEDAVIAALDAQAAATTALQSQVAAVAKAAGVAEDAAPEVVLNAVTTLTEKGGDASAIVALQGELTTVTTELNSVKAGIARTAAETFVDGAIAEGRVGVKPLRDHYVTRHMANAADVEKEIGGMPILNGQTVVPAGQQPGRDAAGKRVLNADEERTVQLMSLDRDAYIAQLDAEDARQANI
jgi:phage I-like protein